MPNFELLTLPNGYYRYLLQFELHIIIIRIFTNDELTILGCTNSLNNIVGKFQLL